MDGGEEGRDGCGRSVSEKESRSERGRKEVPRTNERRWRSRRRVEERGGRTGKGRESSGVRGGRGEKWSGPREAAAAGSGAADGAAKTAETGKRKRQSSERFVEGGGAGGNRWRGWSGSGSGSGGEGGGRHALEHGPGLVDGGLAAAAGGAGGPKQGRLRSQR